MLKSKYLCRIQDNLKAKYAHEVEYLQAVDEFLESLDLIMDNHEDWVAQNLVERMVEPERLISFRIPWADDKGQVHVNRGYRVQFNSAIGPYKGGFRFHPSVNPSIVKFLGFEQTLKNSLTTLPMGGGKGGADFNPKGRSDFEIMRFCQSFMNEMWRHIGEDTDVPAGDIGVGAREVGYLYGQYKKLRNAFTGTLTGKGLAFGGSLGRTEATGYGLCYVAAEALKTCRDTGFKNKKVIISGAGNVGIHAALKARELGATVIAMSDSSGYIYNEDGVDIEGIRDCKAGGIDCVVDFAKRKKNTYDKNPAKMWAIDCDIALPCATQNELDDVAAKALVNNNVLIVAEGANMPATPEAIQVFHKSKILFLPGKAANAGGVLVSGLEMSQNSMRLSWSFDEVDRKLKDTMQTIFHNIHDTANSYDQAENYVFGANIAGFEKVAKAMMAQGLV